MTPPPWREAIRKDHVANLKLQSRIHKPRRRELRLHNISRPSAASAPAATSATGRVGDQSGATVTNASGIDLCVPGRAELIAQITSAAVPAHLNHLRAAVARTG